MRPFCEWIIVAARFLQWQALTAARQASAHECTGGRFKASVARLWEADQNIFLNDNKLLKRLKSLIHVGTWPRIKIAHCRLPCVITYAMLLLKQSTWWLFNAEPEKQFKLVFQHTQCVFGNFFQPAHITSINYELINRLFNPAISMFSQ